MAFRQQHLGVRVVVIVGHVRVEEFGKEAVRLFEYHGLLVVDEGAEVERRLGRSEDFQRAARAQRLALAVAHDERRRALHFREEGGLGDVGHLVARIAAVIGHQEGDLRPVHVAGESGEPVAVGHERALADERCGQVGRGGGEGGAQFARGRRLDPEIQAEMKDRGQHRQPQHGRGHLPVRHAGGLGHHDLVLAMGDIERRRRGDEDRDRHEEGDDLWGRQKGRPQEGEHRGAILDDRVLDLAEPLRKDRDERKTAHDRDEGSQHVTKKIALKP